LRFDASGFVSHGYTVMKPSPSGEVTVTLPGQSAPQQAPAPTALPRMSLAQALQINEFPLSPARLLALIDAARQG
jgi:hypothetical protein